MSMNSGWVICLCVAGAIAATFPLACSDTATEAADGGGGAFDDTGGPVEDAGGGDAGITPDGGGETDAGETPDAGEADAGTPFDGGGQSVGMFLNIGLIEMMAQKIGLAAGAFYPETFIAPSDPNAELKGLKPGTCRNISTAATPECQTAADCKNVGQRCILDTDQGGKPVPGTGRCVNPTGDPIDIGPVTLTGLAGGPKELKYNAGQNGAYTVDGAGDGSVDPATVATDVTYAFTGSGDPAKGIGAFSGTLYVPPAISILDPVPQAGQFGDEIPIDTTKDFTLKWAGSSSGYVRISIQGDNSGLECLTQDDGEFTVPASMMGTVKLAAFTLMNIVNVERRVAGTATGQGLVNPQVSSIVSIMVFGKKP